MRCREAVTESNDTMNMPVTANGLLVEALPDLVAWTDFFGRAEIPVLRETAKTLEALRRQEDANDANSIGEVLSGDPLMTLKVLAHEAAHRGARVVRASETITAAIVMMGVTPFFHAFGKQSIVEDGLAGNGLALTGLNRVVSGARRSADFALAFAAHRCDPQAAVIYTAALLHDFAEMLLWCHAPKLALEVAERQQADDAVSWSAAQREVLHVEMSGLQASLVSTWQLPALLSMVGAGTLANSQTAPRTVSLATRMSRHAEVGWEDATIDEDLDDLARLLGLSVGATLQFMQQI